MTKLHLGCGNHILAGWVNIDLNKGPGIDKVWDLRYGIPYEENEVDLIFTEHMLEHFTQKDGLFFLKECYRVLKPGGTVRIVVPCIERAIALYQGNWKGQHWIDKNDITSGAEFLNAVFRKWGHQFIYDASQLADALKKSGFRFIEGQPYRQSSHLELQSLEVHNDLIVEAEK